MYLEANRPFSIGERIAEKIFPRIRERRQDLEREASVDGLTGLSNRAAFDKARAGAESDKNVCFIVFDCNNFKLVNKDVSHSEGDKVLSGIALIIKRAAKANESRAFRFGGDEFVILCKWSQAVYLRREIENRVGTISFDGFDVSISGCIGSTFDRADAYLQARKTKRKATAAS